MAATAFKERGVNATLSSEARQRIDDARLRDIVFQLRRLIGDDQLPQDDAESLARAVLAGVDNHHTIDREFIFEELIQSGRTKHKAEILANVLFK
jgi:hypothetical protein